ncbi:MAG TPA: hypothetical protein VHS78_07750 [Candidatus Elarobacter sp.]|nr:hypothetical protein [Candidatus Elarobacter sp.]
MSDRYDRAVAGLLAAAVLTCAVAVVAVRPAPLPAEDAARWIALAAQDGSSHHRYGRSWWVDTLDVGSQRLPYAAQVVTVAPGERLAVGGWALDPRSRLPAARLLYRVDGGPWRPARYHLARPDVAARLQLTGAEDFGYLAEVPTGGLAPGPHELTLATGDRGGALLPTTPLRFAIAPR